MEGSGLVRSRPTVPSERGPKDIRKEGPLRMDGVCIVKGGLHDTSKGTTE